MCNFFSLCSDGNGEIIYFNAEQRVTLKDSDYNTDSHTSIADYYGYKGAKEDKLNKWEYNPFTKILKADQINITDDTENVKQFCDNLDFKTIVPELIIKPIIDPKFVRKHKVTKKDIQNLKKWSIVRASVRASAGASVRASVMPSVWDSVRYSVWDSVRYSVWDSIRASAGDSVRVSVRASVRASVWDSVRASAGDSVWASAGDSVWAYISSFFDVKYNYDFSSCVRLWGRGFVPSFDGAIWRLHQGENMNVVYEISKEEL